MTPIEVFTCIGFSVTFAPPPADVQGFWTLALGGGCFDTYEHCEEYIAKNFPIGSISPERKQEILSASCYPQPEDQGEPMSNNSPAQYGRHLPRIMLQAIHAHVTIRTNS